MNPNTTVTLTSSCATGVEVKWGSSAVGGVFATGASVNVAPATTTVYYVWCHNTSSCNSTAKNITVTVNSPAPCSNITNGLVLGTWNVTGHQLVARQFHGGFWVTQRLAAAPEQFVVRAAEMLQRSDVVFSNAALASQIGCFQYQYSAYGGLLVPNSTQFPTPVGFSLGNHPVDGTPLYTQNSANAPINPNGFFDVANCSYVHGWARDAGLPSGKLTIEIIENGVPVPSMSMVAEETRSDLANPNVGYEDGKYGFTMFLPASLKNGAPHTLSARVVGTNFILNASPKTITGCSNMRIGVESVAKEEVKPLTAYPNPSSGLFSLNFTAIKGEQVDLKVFTTSGRVVLEQIFKVEVMSSFGETPPLGVGGLSEVNHVINLEKQPVGEYLVQVVSNKIRQTVKVVKVD